ncbi:electron transfer flavoprotein subunit beta/FixA family protein, partial [Chlamydiota bacterium]
QITYVRKIEAITDNSIRAERLMEEGYDIIESPLPVLLSVVKEINEPRLPSLKGKIRAKNQPITTFTLADIVVDKNKLGLDGSPTQVKRVFAPPKRAGGEIVHGDSSELSKRLQEELQEFVKN